MDQHDSVCERLGDLAVSLTPGEDRRPDAQEWARISERLDRRPPWRSPRRLVPALALAALVGTGVWLAARRPLTYRVQGCPATSDGADCWASPGAVAFTDGSRITLQPYTRMHIRPLSFGRGAELSLDQGDARLAIAHRSGGRWAVLAGPFRVEVTGTRFSVRWSKSEQVLRVAVVEGEVRVSGGTLAQPSVLRAGQSLQAQAQAPTTGPARGAEARRAVAVGSPHAEPTATPAPNVHAAEHPRLSHPSAMHPSVATPSRKHAEASLGSPSIADRAAPASPAAPAVERGTEVRQEPSADSSVETGPAPPSAGARGIASAQPSWASARSFGLSPPAPATSTRPAPNQVVFAADGRLAGGMTGLAWLARGNGTTLSMPVSRDDYVRLRPSSNGFCASGTVAGLNCADIPHSRCNWDRNWGVAIGFDVGEGGGAWGEGAARGIAVEFHGRSSSYRLNAHRKGDPPEKNYCIDDYKSERMVTPSMFKTRCWEGGGESLPDFKDVDLFNLQFQSGMEYVAFHYCISTIRLDK